MTIIEFIELKELVEKWSPSYFSKKTMAFFGDTIENYGIRDMGEDFWELYRKHPVKNGIQSSTFFDKKTGKIVYSIFKKVGE